MIRSAQVLLSLRALLIPLVLVLTISGNANAQQPFVTDDSDVTPKGHFHFEFSNEFDLLQRASFPSLKQNTADFELDYGLFEGVEIGIAAPFLTIFNAAGTVPKTAAGIGDINVSVKYNSLNEREKSRVPVVSLLTISRKGK